MHNVQGFPYAVFFNYNLITIHSSTIQSFVELCLTRLSSGTAVCPCVSGYQIGRQHRKYSVGHYYAFARILLSVHYKRQKYEDTLEISIYTLVHICALYSVCMCYVLRMYFVCMYSFTNILRRLHIAASSENCGAVPSGTPQASAT